MCPGFFLESTLPPGHAPRRESARPPHDQEHDSIRTRLISSSARSAVVIFNDQTHGCDRVSGSPSHHPVSMVVKEHVLKRAYPRGAKLHPAAYREEPCDDEGEASTTISWLERYCRRSRRHRRSTPQPLRWLTCSPRNENLVFFSPSFLCC